jgi:hypothetical protein
MLEEVGDDSEGETEVEVGRATPHSDRSWGNDSSPNELSPELIIPLDPLPEFWLPLSSTLAFLLASLSFVACLALSAINWYGFIWLKEVVEFIWSGKEGNLLLVRELDVGEERGREVAFGGTGSREDGMNGILYEWVINERKKTIREGREGRWKREEKEEGREYWYSIHGGPCIFSLPPHFIISNRTKFPITFLLSFPTPPKSLHQ